MVRSLRAVLLVAGLIGVARSAPAAQDGVFVNVTSPITSLVTNQVKSVVEKARTATDHPAKVVVFDFTPKETEAFSRDFGPCHDLARYIRELTNQHGVQTVAFAQKPIRGHSVLPALACTQIVLGPDAMLGPVVGVKGGPERLDDIDIKVYEAVAGTGKRAAVAKMFDRDVRLVKGTKDGADIFLDDRQRGEAAKAGIINIRPVEMPSLRGNGVAAYSALDARTLGLCQSVLATHREVAEAFELPVESLRGEGQALRPPEVWKIQISGRINNSMAETIQRRVRRALSQRANVLIFELDCSDGDPIVAGRISEYLRSLSDKQADEEAVRTIAYIPKEASDLATFLALGCSELAMRPQARLGDFGAYTRANPRYADSVRVALDEVARQRGFPQVLVQGMFEPNLIIKQVPVREANGQVRRQLLTEDQLRALPAGRADPNAGATVKEQGQLLVITGEQARNLNLAIVVGDLPELYASYGFEAERVRSIDQDWLENLATFLRRWEVTALLVLVGIGCMVLELKMPGFGAPGIISAVCFVLFFWAHSQYSGQLALLAGLLFLLGLILLAVEIFVLPGFGVTGVSGISLIIVGLGLATMERLPQTSAEWTSFGGIVSGFAAILIGGSMATFLLVHFLPYIPFLNRLAPPGPLDHDDADGDFEGGGGLSAERAALLGQVGVTTTILRPAGMARFGDDLVDVVSDGGFVAEGVRIRVIELEGNRIVVKEL